MPCASHSEYRKRPQSTRITRASVFCLLALLLLPFSQALAGLAASVTLQLGEPTAVRPGEVTTLEITLSNNNDAADIASVAFSNNLPGALPDGLKVAAPATYTCYDPVADMTNPGSGTLTAVQGTQAIQLANGVIPRRNGGTSTDGTCTILIPVTPGSSDGAATNYTYTIASGAVTGDDGSMVANVGDVNQSINVIEIARPTISKSFSSNTVVLGGNTSILTITVDNPNPVAIPDFSISDVFPSMSGGIGGGIVQVASPVNTGSNCTGGGTPAVFAALSGGETSVSASGGTLAANGSCTLTVEIAARHSNGAYTTGNRSNTIDAVSQFSNEIGIQAQANASANIRVNSPLDLTKSFSPSSLADGQNGSMTITLSNSGDSPLTVQSFTDSPIDGIGDADPMLGIKVNGAVTVNCPGGTDGSFTATANNVGITQSANSTIAAGGSCTISVPIVGQTMVAHTPITYTNTILEGAVDVGDPAIVSRGRTATILVADTLRVLKERNTGNPRPGNPVKYTIRVQNWSASVMNNVRIQDPLENGMGFLTGIINGNDFSPTLSGSGCSGLTVNSMTDDGTADLVIGSIQARISDSSPRECTVVFYAMTDTAATDGTSTVNTLPTGSVCVDNGAGFCNGGSASSDNSAVNAAVLTIAKGFNPAGPLPEGTITRMTITLGNYSVNPLSNVSISDTLPISGSVQMQVADPANALTTCGSGVITATPGSSSVALNNGSVPARADLGAGAAGTCTLQVDVVGPAGVYNNTATAAGTQTYANNTTGTAGPLDASAGITFNSVLAATKGFSPGTVSSGGRSTVTVRMENSGPVALANVSVTDPLPAGMVVADPANAYTTCDGTTSISATPGSGSVSMSGASIAGNGNCDLLFDVIASGGGNWVNSIPVGGIEAVGSGVINQSAVVGTLLGSAGDALTVAKATNPSNLTFPGQVSRLTVTITNGTEAVSGLSLTDYFTLDGNAGSAANGMVLTPSPQAATTCPGGSVSATPGGDSFTLSGASLGAGASCTFSVNVTSTTTGGITNFIPVGAIATNQGLSNAGQATTSLTTQTNLGVLKQFTPNVIKPNERSRLRITFFNPTSRVASSLSVLDTMPSGVTIPAGANPTTTCSGATVSTPAANQVQVSGGTLGAASGTTPASCYAEIDVTAVAEGVYVNEIPAGDLTGLVGGIPSSNSQPTSDTLRVKEPVQVRKAIGGFTRDAGSPDGFTTGSAARAPGAAAPLVILLKNPNAAALTQAGLVDSLPSGLVVATTPNASTDCADATLTATPSATSIALTGATLPAAGSCRVTVDVLSNIPGTYVNTVESGKVTTFEGVSNEEATSAEIIVSFPPTVGKEFSPAVIPPGGTSRLTLVFGNDNAGPVTLTSAFTDTLPTSPGAMLIASPADLGNSCSGSVTATPGAGSITLGSGATIPAGGCSIAVDVTAATAGTHNNNIPAGDLQTDLGVNQQPANAALMVSTQGFISGRVFKDNDVTPNGTFDLGKDSPIAGVSIALHTGSGCSGVAAQTTTTDAQGKYLFHSLAAGTYSVCEPGQPSGTSNGITSAGSITQVAGSTGSQGAASNPSATSSQIVGIVLNNDGSGGETSGSPDNNFAEVVLSSISGTVFMDYNNNGLLNGPDTGLAGQTLELLDNGGGVVDTTTTDAQGNYRFADLQPGTYSVRQPNQPPNTSNGITTPGSVSNGGTAGSAAGVATLPSRINGIVLPANAASPDNDFAEIPNSRTISGMVFFDFDDSGTLDGTDYGIAGQTIQLSGTDLNSNPVSRMTTTAASGGYVFSDLPEGTYTVTQPNQPANSSNGKTLAGSTGGMPTDPATTPSVISGIDLTGANSISGDNDFAEIPAADSDLTVDKTHTPNDFGDGSSTGYFTLRVGNIGSTDTLGSITVVDTLPTGMTLAAPAEGEGWSCSGAVGASSVSCSSSQVIASGGTGAPIILRVVVAPGLTGQLLTNSVTVSGGGEPAGFNANNSDQDTVAVAGVARVSGQVWVDEDHDRIPGGGETRLSGWLVELLLNGVLVGTASTDENGAYTLDKLSPGSGYQIRFRHPQTGHVWGYAVANEQGLTPTQGTRDDPANPVTSNAGNPAGASTNDGTLSGLTLFAGDNILEQSLPVDPSGVVYDSVTRVPIAGAVVTLVPENCATGFDPAQHLVGGSANLAVTTGADGYYGFLLTPTAPQCDYTLAVTQPEGYGIPPSNALSPSEGPLVVPAGPGILLIQGQATAPVVGQDTTYYFSFRMSGSSQSVVNNHIPLDPPGPQYIPVLPYWAMGLLGLLLALVAHAGQRGRRIQD